MARLSKTAWHTPSLKRKEVEVADLGGSVLVRELPAAYSAELNQHATMKQVGREQVATVDLVTMERLKFAYGVIDDDGEPLFNADEAKQIAEKHGHAFKVVLEAIDELSEIDAEAIQVAADKFPNVGTRTNGGPLGERDAAGGGGPDVPARTGAGIEDVGG